jgi:hypothetical protein
MANNAGKDITTTSTAQSRETSGTQKRKKNSSTSTTVWATVGLKFQEPSPAGTIIPIQV